jgi:hypothetical protein
MTSTRRLILPVLVAACAPAASDPVATEGDAGHGAELAFRAGAERVGARTDRRVIAWGTARLGDDGRPRRFAVLEPDDLRRGRGAYLIEDTPRALWLVSYHADGRTVPWGLRPGDPLDGDPTWQVLDEVAIEHAQGHPQGGEEIVFALRRGQLVVLAHDHLGEVGIEVVERRRFARDGVCTEPCPPLRGHATDDLALRVAGPSPTIDALLAADHDRPRPRPPRKRAQRPGDPGPSSPPAG